MRRLPLFVLPAALLPGAVMPLHVFEPRYRRMIARCLEGDRQFGVIFFPEDAADFELVEGMVGCVAEIVEFGPMPDGRSLVLARGIDRFAVVDGIENDEEYHEALVEPFVDAAFAPGDLMKRREDLIALVRDRMEDTALSEDGDAAVSLPSAADGDVSFRLAALLDAAPEWYQALLELPTERARLREIARVLTS